ncbi:YggT family protein [Phreatobacter cathodiphilus]|uniref:YggT family protein n=1 Tax=Phreatobacter cathodiphilus TaxID=1868589 RepID=A0A2S0N9C3_9HYPH|nr:YggT family protein [Phreatobacter cathodiphilus]AVO44607.1 YggT family protein [Phreatobacter cathodiphilus]
MTPSAADWLYHGPNLVIAALLYTLIGRYILSLLFKPDSDKVIWRVFAQVTDPVLGAVRAITPAVVPNGLVMIAAIFWLIILRMLWLLVAAMWGFLPRVGA